MGQSGRGGGRGRISVDTKRLMEDPEFGEEYARVDDEFTLI